jgi:hypothetical protein
MEWETVMQKYVSENEIPTVPPQDNFSIANLCMLVNLDFPYLWSTSTLFIVIYICPYSLYSLKSRDPSASIDGYRFFVFVNSTFHSHFSFMLALQCGRWDREGSFRNNHRWGWGWIFSCPFS